MARGRKTASPLSPSKLWRPDRAVRNFLALHSLRYQTNKVGGVDIYKLVEEQHFEHASGNYSITIKPQKHVMCTFGNNTTPEKALKFIIASLEYINGTQTRT